MIILIYLCLFIPVYTYFFYPALLFVFSQIKNHSETKILTSKNFKIAIIITVYNESRVIKEKLEQILALNYLGTSVLDHLLNKSGLIELIVASDGSDDETNKIVNSYYKEGIRLVALNERSGKEKAQSEAIEVTSAEIIIFTDAKTIMQADSLDKFVSYFNLPQVAAVSSVDVVSGNSVESLYVRYEMFIRKLESNINSLIGLSGSCFAVRKEICNPFPVGIPSDFALALQCMSSGFRAIHAEDIPVSYTAHERAGDELSRKVRTIVRGISALFQFKELLNPITHRGYAVCLISHKLFRWLSPLFLLIGIILCIVEFNLIYEFLVALIMSLLVIVIFRQTRIVKILKYFLLANTAVLIAWYQYLIGKRYITWKPSERNLK